MKYLLDTHTVIWHSTDDSRLSDQALGIIESDHSLWVSYVSIWEMAIKIQRGRLELKMSLEAFVDDVVSKNEYNLLEINQGSLFLLASLPYHHKDPFDRLLITQAMDEQMTIVTKDLAFQDYEVATVW